MADLSVSFNPNDGSNALSKVTARSATWDKASDASALAATLSDAASNALSKATAASGAAVTAQSKASDASSAAAMAIKTSPGTNSRAIHEMQVASNGTLKIVYSSLAAV